ncbi:gamma-glutamylcyclotransferase family protein [Niallia sp. 01092]|uniref:gamma-glutamylcyclotransferase family protein n=1 Tax=unclassified Niallia TaxID=2837522 RepID=UPI003FD19D8B
MAKEVWVYGKLYDAGAGYPFLTLDQEKKVVGEIYEVPVEKIKELDDFEEFIPGAIDNIYERMLIEVYGENAKWHAYIYICNRKQMLVEEIEHGDWKLVESSKKF